MARKQNCIQTLKYLNGKFVLFSSEFSVTCNILYHQPVLPEWINQWTSKSIRIITTKSWDASLRTSYELRLTEESGKVTVSIQYRRCFFARIVNVLLLILLLLMMMMMRKGEEMSVGAVSMRLVSGDLPVDRQPPAYQRSSRRHRRRAKHGGTFVSFLERYASVLRGRVDTNGKGWTWPIADMLSFAVKRKYSHRASSLSLSVRLPAR